MIRPVAFALAAATLLAPVAARAESVQVGAFEFKLGSYRPQIGAETGLTTSPYSTAFGSKSILLGELEFDKQFFQSFGTLAAGFSLGYGEVYGHGVYGSGTDAGTASEDSTALRLVPLKLLAVYRFDVLAKRYDIPLVPFLKVGLVDVLWQSLDGTGAVSKGLDGKKGEGGRLGYEGALGLSLLLDFFDQSLADEFDKDVGVNHSYLFGEYRIDKIDGFGSKGIILSDNIFSAGLALEF
jgi:hypothetical protein